jgi:hypothetical protein
MTITVLAQSGYTPWNVRKFHFITAIANLAIRRRWWSWGRALT